MNNELEALKVEASEMALFAKGLADGVTDAEGEREAVLFLGKIKGSIKQAKVHFDFLTKPLKEHIKTIKAEFDAIAEPLEEAERIVGAGIIKWRNGQEFKQKEEKRLALEAYAKEAVRQNDIDKLQVIASEHENIAHEAPKVVKTEGAKMHMRESWQFEIIDIALVPKEFLLINEPAIRAALKEGTEIAGVKSWKVMKPVIVQ